MTTEEKFRAAVNVIKNLPKNGSYQPSHELMLRFYAYFKQATEGPCKAQKPGFWEVVKKMKWEAWNRLGNMPREEAMENYVEELKKIVETMSYTDNVASFLGSLGSFYDHVPLEDLELLVGPVLERIRSQPGSPLGGSPIGGSPFGSREPSPTRAATTAPRVVSSLETSPASSYSASPLPPDAEDDDDEDEFKDTLESTPLGRETIQHLSQPSSSPPKKPSVRVVANGHGPPVSVANGINGIHGINGINNINGMNGHLSEDEETPTESNHGTARTCVSPRATASSATTTFEAAVSSGSATVHTVPDISDNVATAMARLQADLDQAMGRLSALEKAVLTREARQGVSSAGAASASIRVPRWWPLRDITPRTFVLLALWPLALHVALTWLQRRRRALPMTRFP